jgi:pimeloyl-ACP methyl ester carboxylesterase
MPRSAVDLLKSDGFNVARAGRRGANCSANRFVESMRYVRAYPTELPILRDMLPTIQTPVQIIARVRDTAIPPSNAEFLHARLPKSKPTLSTLATSRGRTTPAYTPRS